MRTTLSIVAGSILSVLGLAVAQTASAADSPPMTFFVTSVSPGFGGDLGGLEGADKHCQQLAASTELPAVTAKTWHAYLSTSAADGKPAVNARDRIGKGPWHNAKGTLIANNVAELHGDTLETARPGNHINVATALDEDGKRINFSGGPVGPLMHDILTGSKPDGTAYTDNADHTCKNWTSSRDGSAQIGHHDRAGSSSSWNSAHETLGCSPGLMQKWGGGGLLYCFATN